MSLEHFNKLLATHNLIIDLKRDAELRRKFKQNEDEVLAMYNLTDAERTAVKNRDFRAMYDMGVHQYLVAQMARLIYGTEDGSNDGGAVTIFMEQMLKNKN
jgi:protocatechuate 4,5-dioxygenase alpha chain